MTRDSVLRAVPQEVTKKLPATTSDMGDVRSPRLFNFDAPHLKKEWEEWLQNFGFYLIASKKKNESNEIKIAILLNQLGPRGVELYNTFVADETAKPTTTGESPKATDVLQKYSEVVDAFTNYFAPRKNVLYERYKFNNIKLVPGQSLIEFATTLKTAAASCDYSDRNNMVRDRIVAQVPDNNLLNRLLDEGDDLTLEKAIELCQLHENRQVEIKEFEKTADQSQQVDAMHKTGQKKFSKNRKQQRSSPKAQTYKCKKCNNDHTYGNCPAYNEICANCKNLHHYAICCPYRNKKGGNSKYRSNRKVDAIESISEDSDECYLDGIMKIDNLTSDDINWHIIGIINHCNVKFKIDSGSHVNVLPLRIYEKVKTPDLNLKASDIKLSAYNNNKLTVVGEIMMNTKFNHMSAEVPYLVIDTKDKPILGLKICSDLNIIKKVHLLDKSKNLEINFKSKDEIISEYKDVFTGLGKFPGKPYKIHLKDDAVPVTYSPRRVPKHLHERLKSTLNRLEQAKIISKCEEPSEWQHPLVIVEKADQTLRLCLDPKDLNKQILDDQYQIPKMEEIFDDLANKTNFSVVDLRESFFQVPICSESAKLCTFGTPFGSYKFERLPFGIKISAEVFQKKNFDIFGSIHGVKIYIDDIVIAGSSKAEHDAILKQVLDKARVSNITLNPDKFKYNERQIKLLGHIISEQGIAIDPNRIQAIKEMPEPNDKDSLLRFLGIVKYVGNFIPNLSELTAPLRELTKDGQPWSWTETHSKTVEILKNLIVNSPVLAHYKHNEPLVIQCDASSTGLGCALLQNNQPIAFASRSIRKSESGWAIIEKELRAVLFALEKFHYFVYGREVEVQTDHKPLINIMQKKLEDVPKRLQNMRLKLLKYTFKITHVPGKQMILADALSRAYLRDSEKNDPDFDYVIHAIIKSTMSQERHKILVDATRNDPYLSKVASYIKSSWPENLSGEVGRFALIKNDLSIQKGLIFYGDRIVVPVSQRKPILSRLHVGHLGIEKTRSKARKAFYWPGMSAQIGESISSCVTCQESRTMNCKEPMIPSDIPLRPWAKIGIDILDFQNKSYVVAMDYYSKWIEYDQISKKSAHEVISWCHKTFASYGFPITIISDNNPFSSREFTAYLAENDIQLVTSSPHYSQGHALAETGVKIVENILRKTIKTEQNPHVLLMQYRNTPIPALGVSPSQLMLGRSLRDDTNFNETDLEIKPVNKTYIAQKLAVSQKRQKNYYDRNSKPLPEVKVNDQVIYRHNNKWNHGLLIGKSRTPRSWMIQGEGEKTFRRNRRDFILVKSDGKADSDYYPYLNTSHKINTTNREPQSPKRKRYSLRDRSQIKRVERLFHGISY